MNYKDMKIEINESQSIDEVVRELERLGFIRSKHGRWVDRDKFILTSEYGYYSRVDFTSCNFYIKTTLTELKAMNND